MHHVLPYKIVSCGDHAVTIDFGNTIDETINNYILHLFHHLKQKNIPGIKDILPAYSSLTVVYDVITIHKIISTPDAYIWITQQLEMILQQKQGDKFEEPRIINIPVCYEEQFAPDLHELAAHKNITPESVGKVHYSKPYRVFMLGFLPGFAYMGTVEKIISMPRKTKPRLKVPEGSVGIAGLQTGIYPMESPGGWNIIGQTPIKLFDANKPGGALLQPGDHVHFYPVTVEEFEKIKSAQ